MKKILFVFLIMGALAKGRAQKNCFDEANKYRKVYLDQTDISFDSLQFHLQKGHNMLLGCKMPNDSLVNLSGSRSSIEKYAGKIRIINFWSVYCAPCVNEIASFHALMKKYGNKLHVFAVTLDQKPELLKFLQKHPFNAEIIPDARDFVYNYSLGSGYPFTLVIDTNGKIIYVKSGGDAAPETKMDLFKEMEPVIDAALK